MDTRIETKTDIRRWEASVASGQTCAGTADSTDGTIPFQPLERTPTAFVCVLDDDQRGGQWVRLRSGKWTVGRTQGDFVLPNDPALSREHFQIELQDGSWMIRDLDSSNGTFVRILTAPLTGRSEILLGSTMLEIDCATNGSVHRTEGAEETRRAGAENQRRGIIRVREVTTQEPQEWSLDSAGSHSIGRHPDCSVCISADAMVNHRHCAITRGNRNRLVVKDNESMNGTWLRVDKLRVTNAAEVQVGEQRFLIRIGSQWP